MPYIIFHSSDKILLSPKLTRRHLQGATKFLSISYSNTIAREHIKPEDFDNATTYKLQFTIEKFTYCCNFLYIPHLNF